MQVINILPIIIFVATLTHQSTEAQDLPHKCSHVMKNRKHAVCPLFPESIEGPYYLDYQQVRQNITEGKPGIPLKLTMTVVNFTTCSPLPNVAVDIWQCDAFGEYSSFVGVEKDERQRDAFPLDDKTFLRGVQYTDMNGTVEFFTIFPGWYHGRTVHIHLDVHVNGEKHTGQLYFTETLTAEIEQLEPYVFSNVTRLRNSEDEIFLELDGLATQLNLDSVGDAFQASILMGYEN